MSKALPAFFYGDPEKAAMVLESRSCNGCKSLLETLGREFCGVGMRKLERCRRYQEKEAEHAK